MNRPEEIIHRAVAAYLAVATSPADGVWFAHVPNGGHRSKAEAGILKAMGTKAGVPDILIIHNGIARWIELKAPQGRVSPAQTATIRDLDRAMSQTAICRSVEEVETQLRLWGIPLRARAA